MNISNVMRMAIDLEFYELVAFLCDRENRTAYGEFILYGAVGGALDHTFANVAIAHDIARRGAKALMIGEEYSFTVLHGSSFTFEARDSGRISVFALGGTAQGGTIRGLDYEVEDRTIESTSHIGVSNAFVGKEATISVRQGELLVVWQTE